MSCNWTNEAIGMQHIKRRDAKITQYLHKCFSHLKNKNQVPAGNYRQLTNMQYAYLMGYARL